jgi:hypothetical protein
LFAADILKVLYAPHKVFKQIIQNPKYWGPILILLLFAGAETGLFFAQYSKMYYEETNPAIGQLTAWTDSPTLWTTMPTGATITSNTVDIMNTTFYGNTSLQFYLSNSSSISMIISNFNGSSVNCGPNGFTDLYVQIKVVEPATSPSIATLQLFSQGATNYFQSDLTSTFSNSSSTWNNYTIPVGSGNWQSTGNPDWGSITGLNLTLNFPETTNLTLRMGGLFFRGVYQTPIAAGGAAGFAANALFTGVFFFIVQWLAFAVVFYLLIKLMKGPVTWKPLFIAVAFALAAMVVETLLVLAATLTLPNQIHYPFEFAIAYLPTYPAAIVATFSSASQTIYNSVIAPGLANYLTIQAVVTIATYVWISIIGAFLVRAMTEFSFAKSILTSAASVVLTYVILSLLIAFGII